MKTSYTKLQQLLHSEWSLTLRTSAAPSLERQPPCASHSRLTEFEGVMATTSLLELIINDLLLSVVDRSYVSEASGRPSCSINVNITVHSNVSLHCPECFRECSHFVNAVLRSCLSANSQTSCRERQTFSEAYSHELIGEWPNRNKFPKRKNLSKIWYLVK